MNILPSAIALFFLIFFLVKSADLLEDSFVGISKKLGINTFTTGFLIIAMTSSLPEAFVAINSVANNAPGLSLGNILGATIILLTLITGLTAIRRGSIPFKGFYGPTQVFYSLILIFSQIVSLLDGKLTWFEGLFLVIEYTIFIIYIVKQSHDAHPFRKHHKIKSTPYSIIIKGIIGIAGLIISSNLTVTQALNLAEKLNIPPLAIGLLLFSIGTNLPEIIIMLRSNNLEKNKLALGSFMGSATFNTAVLGILTILNPFSIQDFNRIIPAILILATAIFIYAEAVFGDKEITKKEGYLLLSVFGIFLITEGLFI